MKAVADFIVGTVAAAFIALGALWGMTWEDE